MAIYSFNYNTGSGTITLAAGSQIIWSLGDSSGVITILTVGNGSSTSSGTLVVSADANGEVPSGSDLSAYPSFAWTAVAGSSTLITPRNVTVRNPGAKFDIKLQDVVAALIGAYWGVKVTVQ